MKKLHWLIIPLFIGITSNAQKTCNNPEDVLVDLNTINKCSVITKEKKDVKKIKETRTVNVKVSPFKKRFLTVRKKAAASTLFSNLNTRGVSETHKATLETEALVAFKKEYTTKVNDFYSVDKVPAFTACKTILTTNEQRVCFNEKLMSFINNNLDYPEEVLEEAAMGVLKVKFIIDTDGEVNNITVSGPKNARLLKEYVIDLVSSMPSFTPAVKKGIEVPVAYEFVLNFSM